VQGHEASPRVLRQFEDRDREVRLTLNDLAFVHAALVPDAAGKIDVEGWNAAWSETFGTAQLPWKPARTTIVLPKLWSPGSTIGEIDCVFADERRM